MRRFSVAGSSPRGGGDRRGPLLRGTGRAERLDVAPGRTRYAKVQRVCQAPRPGDASCLALALVSARPGAAGASAYQPSAGAASTGPAGGLTPADLASAYSYSPSAGGTGQTVAIVDAYDDPKIEEDLATFDAQYGLPACTASDGCFTKVSETGSTTALPAADTNGWSVEIALDVETVHSVCPGCAILLVEASSESFPDLAAAVDEAVSLGATEVSNSYGGLETAFGASEQAAYDHPGVVVAASAGDSGYLNWDDLLALGQHPGSRTGTGVAGERGGRRGHLAETHRGGEAQQRDRMEQQRPSFAGSGIQTVRCNGRRLQHPVQRALLAAGRHRAGPPPRAGRNASTTTSRRWQIPTRDSTYTTATPTNPNSPPDG